MTTGEDGMIARIPQTSMRRPGQVRIVFADMDPGDGARPLASADYFVPIGSVIEFDNERVVAAKDCFIAWTGPWVLDGKWMDAPKLYPVGTAEEACERFGPDAT